MVRHDWQRRGVSAVLAVFACAILGATVFSAREWIYTPFPGFFVYPNLAVAPYSLSYWSGSATGLRPLDIVVSINGSPVRDQRQVYMLVKVNPAGAQFTYHVQRGSQVLQVTVPSMMLSLNDWALAFGVYVVMGIAFLTIGIAPYYFRADSPAALPLCFMVMAVFTWFEATFDFLTTGLLPKQIRLFALTLTPSAGVHLALLLKTGRPLRQFQPAVLVLIYGVAVLLASLNSLTFFGPVDRWILIFRLGYLFTCAGAVAFLVIVWSALKSSQSDLARSRFRVIFAGGLMGFFIPTLSTVLTSSFQWNLPYNFAVIPTVFFPLSVAYALLKYSLFDLGNALKLTITRTGLTVFLLAAYFAIVLVLSSIVGSYDKHPLTPVLFSIVVVLFFNPLLRWIESVVDRYVYRQEYDPAEVQEEVSLYLRSLAPAQAIAAGFLRLIVERFRLQSAGLLYRPIGAHEFIAAGAEISPLDYTSLMAHVSSLWQTTETPYYRAISSGETATDPQFAYRRRELLDVYAQLRAEVIVPIVFERRVRGFAFFGAKRSAREYSADDLRLLRILTDQLALSLENGRLFEESVKAQQRYESLYNKAETVNRQLVETDRLKKQFVANICHELRTPISTIIGYSELLVDRGAGNERGEILQRLVNNAQELSQLMENLLDFTSLEADVFNCLEPVDLAEILDGVELMGRRLIRGRPIEFKVTLGCALQTIHSDRKKIEKILLQLLTNALKFTKQGTIEIKVETVSEDGRDFIEILVCDTGIGIDPKDQALIFEDFRQLDGSSTRQYGGTGLGLNICQKLARALGGRIEVNSVVGVGSVFRVLLPASREQDRRAAA